MTTDKPDQHKRAQKSKRTGKELTIVTHPNPILRRRSEDISLAELKNPAFRQLLLDMEETMIKKDGAGLAAAQVGKNIRVCVIAHDKKTLFCLNPQITRRSWARVVEEEGCLSVLNDQGEIIYAPVERYRKVNFAYWNEKGAKKKIAAADMLARVIQHEIDHLDGILFIDKIAKLPGQPDNTNAK
jgi:peptide deformylase